MYTQKQSLQTKRHSSLLTTGLALFSMFFGAGNLIFPLLIGKSAGRNVWFSILGLGVTAVIVPFLGLATMVLFQADLHRFFGCIGKVPGRLLLFLLQVILGPFGVIPRLVTLMHATAAPHLLDMPLILFSALAAGLIFACSLKREWLIGILGKILTPLLLLSLAALVFSGLKDSSSLSPASSSAGNSFFEGLLGGYNTMDLIAAFLFATVVLPHFKQEVEEKQAGQRRRSLLRKMFFSSLIAASILFLTYVGLCLISAHHGGALDTACPPEQLLTVFAMKLLGSVGGSIATVAVITACLTTAMTLALIFAEYLRKDLCREKISPAIALGITLAVTTLFANLGFGGIAAFLGPILQIVYPGLILLTGMNLFHALYGYRMVRWPIFLAFAASGVIYLMHC